ncbi:MAG: hypothetical protein JWN48_3845 [Myxococcaceae bacterium]|nr:hypothetical protein [Myxococcaceae bacterium]
MRAPKCRPAPLLPLLFSGSMLLGSLLLPALTPRAHAAPSKGAKAHSTMSMEEVMVMLSSPVEDEVRTALETAAMLPPRDSVPMLEDRVRSGLSRVLLDVAIDSLMLLDDKSASPLLLDLVRHRRPEVRVRTLEVMGRLKAPNLQPALVRALSDQEPAVRNAAASALAESGAESSVAPLTEAYERGVESAGAALGKLGKPEHLLRMLEGYAGKLPLGSITALAEALLERRDVSEADKLRAVGTVTRLPGDDASTGAAALLERLPKAASPRVRQALTEAVEKGSTP